MKEKSENDQLNVWKLFFIIIIRIFLKIECKKLIVLVLRYKSR